MGRKNKSKGPPVAVELNAEVASVVESKQKEGDVAAGLKKYGDALAAYDAALKELPERHSLIAQLHGSKAAVYLMDKKYKEAVKECNQGLAVEGSNPKVLERRAKARFELGMFKDALGDIQKVNASSAKSEESAEFEGKVRQALSGNKAGSGGAGKEGANGAVSKASPVSKEQTAHMLRSSQQQFVCKVTLDDADKTKCETKYLHIPYGITYWQLQKAIKDKWTGLHNFKVYFQDRDNDWVLITSHKDVAKAQQEILSYAQRVVSQRQRQGLDAQPPTCRFKVEKCRRADVPQPPKEEVPKGEESSRVVVKSADPHAEETVVELDDWLIDFANLFREQMGIDPDKHVDMQTEGIEACNRALDTVVRLPEARGLFDESLQRFRDVTCIGLCNWANVYVCLGKKTMEAAAEDGKPASEIEKEVYGLFEQAIQRYEDALSFHGQCVEAMLGKGQVYIERARMEGGILVPGLDNVDSETYKVLNAEEVDEINRAQGKESNTKLRLALDKVKKSDVEKTAATWSKAYQQFDAAQEAASAEKLPRTVAREEAREDRVVSPPYQDNTHLMPNQVKIMMGNALYDQSQIWAGLGLEGWKDMALRAQALFLDATCKESDVMDALRNHICADELDLPPEPEAPEASAKEAATTAPSSSTLPAASAVEKERLDAAPQGPKGLPSLGKKKKGGK